MAVQNTIAYIEKTMPKLIDKVQAQDSLTAALIGGSEIKLDFLDARTVKITKLASTGLQSYNRGGHGNTNANGAVQSLHETFTLSQERYSAIPLDKLDTLDDGETVFANLAKEFSRTKVVQEFDAYRFAKMCQCTSVEFGNRVVISKANLTNHIIGAFNNMLQWMEDNKVPQGECVIYISPEAMSLVRSTTELYRKLSQSEYAGKVSFAIQNYEDKPIVVVPSDEFYSEITTGNGYYPTANAKKIHFMAVWKKAPVIVTRLDWTKVYDSDTVKLGYVGYSFENLFYHDLFVPDNKRVGIYACVSDEGATSSANMLRIFGSEAGASGKSKLVAPIVTAPGGLLWDAIGLYTTNGTAPAIGSTFADKSVAEVGDNAEVTFKEFTPNASHNIFVATYDGKVVAVSKDFDDSDLNIGA